jgi:hypothetical protein
MPLMATPPEQPSRPGYGSGKGEIAGLFVGILAGPVLGTVLSFLVFATSSSSRSCGSALAWSVVALLIIGALLGFAWHLIFRVKEQSFGLGVARGAVSVAALMALIPWPCSLASEAINGVAPCFPR